MIATFMRLFGQPGRPVAVSNDAQLEDQMTQAMVYLLGVEEAHAQPLAQGALRQRQFLRGGRSLQATPSHGFEPARQGLHAALASGPCLLALPFSVTGICLLRSLSADPALHLVLVQSPLLRTLGDEIPLARRPMPVCSTQNAVAQVKMDAARRTRTVYVSFPELQPLGHGTTASIAFLGKPCRFSMLDPLLGISGVAAVLTPTFDGAALLAWNRPPSREGAQGAAMHACLHWLIEHLQTSAAAAPDLTLSWPHLYRASLHFYRIERANQLKQLEAWTAAWARSSPGQANRLAQFAQSRVAALSQAGSH